MWKEGNDLFNLILSKSKIIFCFSSAWKVILAVIYSFLSLALSKIFLFIGKTYPIHHLSSTFLAFFQYFLELHF